MVKIKEIAVPFDHETMQWINKNPHHDLIGSHEQTAIIYYDDGAISYFRHGDGHFIVKNKGLSNETVENIVYGEPYHSDFYDYYTTRGIPYSIVERLMTTQEFADFCEYVGSMELPDDTTYNGFRKHFDEYFSFSGERVVT